MGTYDAKIDMETASPKQLYYSNSALLIDMIVTLKAFMSFGDTPLNDELLKGKMHLMQIKISRLTT